MKTLKQFLKEFWIPATLAILLSLYNYLYGEAQNKKFIEIFKSFGTAFFLFSWFGGHILRIIKQRKTETSLENLLNRLELVSSNLENVNLDIRGYSTGGESLCYLQIIKNDDAKKDIFALMHVGKYPLYSITMVLENLNDPIHKDILKRPRFKAGDLSPGIVKLLKDDDDIDSKNDEEDNFILENNTENYIKYIVHFYCRKGHFEQDIRIIKFEGKWFNATQVRNNHQEIIFTKIDDDFPIKYPFKKN